MIYTHVLRRGARSPPFRCVPQSPNVRNDRCAISTSTRRILPIATERTLYYAANLTSHNGSRPRVTISARPTAMAHGGKVTLNE